MASASPAKAAKSSPGSGASALVLEQPVLGSRRLSNVLVAAVVSTGGLGFLLTSASSYLGTDLLPIGHPAALSWVPQGLVMGLYGIAAALLSTYLWTVIALDVGSGANRFDKSAGTLTVTPVNDPPVANDTEDSGNEDSTIPVDLSGSDPDGTVASASAVRNVFEDPKGLGFPWGAGE